MKKTSLITFGLILMLASISMQILFISADETIPGPGTYQGYLSYGNRPVTAFNTEYGDFCVYEIQLFEGETGTLTLQVPSGADLDLSLECDDFPQTGHEDHYLWAYTSGAGVDEEAEFTIPHDGKYYIGVLCYSGSGYYTLTIEIENREKEAETLPGSGTYSGSLTHGMYPVTVYADFGDYMFYEIQLSKDAEATFTLDVPSGCDFDIQVECTDYSAGHEDHYWRGDQRGSMDEEVSFTVPHDGIYVVFVFDYSGSGSYSLGVEITAPSGGGIPGFPLEAILLGLVLTGFALTVLKKRTNVIR